MLGQGCRRWPRSGPCRASRPSGPSRVARSPGRSRWKWRGPAANGEALLDQQVAEFQRREQEFQVPRGPPWMKTTRATGLSAETSRGRISHDCTSTPSAARVVSRSATLEIAISSSLRPGKGGGLGSLTGISRAEPDRAGWCGHGRPGRRGWRRQGGGVELAEGAAGGQQRDRAHIPPSTRSTAALPRRSAATKTASESGAQAISCGQTASRAADSGRPSPLAMSTSQTRASAALSGSPFSFVAETAQRPFGRSSHRVMPGVRSRQRAGPCSADRSAPGQRRDG